MMIIIDVVTITIVMGQDIIKQMKGITLMLLLTVSTSCSHVPLLTCVSLVLQVLSLRIWMDSRLNKVLVQIYPFH